MASSTLSPPAPCGGNGNGDIQREPCLLLSFYELYDTGWIRTIFPEEKDSSAEGWVHAQLQYCMGKELEQGLKFRT